MSLLDTAVTQEFSYRALLEEGVKRLYNDFDTPRIDAEVLLLHAVKKDMSWLIVYGDRLAEKDHIIDFYELIEQRAVGQPIAYLTGHKEFWSLDLIVNPSVLIPRPDTETLVEQALESLSKNEENSILDLGTGSGAIALAIAKERPQDKVLATDNSPTALNVAKQNAEKNNITNVSFIKSDWFSQIDGQEFELIISNPPYIEPDDAHLQQGDLRFEPETALIGAGDGLDDIRHIISTACIFLSDGAHLIIEHGYNQQQQATELFTQHGYQNIKTHQDLNKLPRCTLGTWLKR